jgi:hypothetical protein
MIALICFVLAVLASSFKSKSRLEAENAVLRHQLIVLRRKVRGRVQPTNNGRWFLVQMYRWFPSILKVVTIVQPETLVRWHRAGFRRYWGWKSNLRGGRPRIEIELRALIRQAQGEGRDLPQARQAGAAHHRVARRRHSRAAPARSIATWQSFPITAWSRSIAFYTVEEAARCLAVHKNTVRRWIKAGPPTVGGRG